ncbi:hypothetical protein [Vibrio splendidus]|uniref:Uncharacterized protein n=1 Tax=Vibrio splendidus TaxID=29497 RepID=A0A2N7K0Z4_VIBSP|nr:hypothetical protein [Vibrio splendidus]PMM66858.1 hypothetical protein BCT54_02175 [Vibrio splendidus]
MNNSPIQVRFNASKSIDMAMCKRYEESGNRAGTLRNDVLVGHALAQANPVLYQMVLAMAKANDNGSIKIDELKKIIELVSGSSPLNESIEPVKKDKIDIGGMGELGV